MVARAVRRAGFTGRPGAARAVEKNYGARGSPGSLRRNIPTTVPAVAPLKPSQRTVFGSVEHGTPGRKHHPKKPNAPARRLRRRHHEVGGRSIDPQPACAAAIRDHARGPPESSPQNFYNSSIPARFAGRNLDIVTRANALQK